MHLSELVSDNELLALEPDELGVHILSVVADQSSPNVGYLLSATKSNRTAFPSETWDEVEEAIREAWAWLEGAAFLLPASGQIGLNSPRVLSRRARQIVSEKDPHRALAARRLPKDAIHPSIREDVWSLYQRGKYPGAVFEAMKAVEIAVRDAAGYPLGDHGTPMIGKAFNEDNGPLRDPAAPQSERIALRSLFVGAIGSYKNPHSHRNVPLDPAEAAEIIVLATHLLRILDAKASA